MKVFTILIILLSVFSFSTYSLRLSNLGKVIASEAALIPTVKQISTYELSKINFAQIKSRYFIGAAIGVANNGLMIKNISALIIFVLLL